jgi:xanthine dehydrogenase small subunit
MRVAQNLLQKFWLETRAVEALEPQATSVWTVMPHHVGSDEGPTSSTASAGPRSMAKAP